MMFSQQELNQTSDIFIWRHFDFSTGSEPSVLKYRENEIYKYKYEGQTSIHLPNSLKGESTKLNYLANFDIIPESKCSFILRVSSVEIIGPDGKVISTKRIHRLEKYVRRYLFEIRDNLFTLSLLYRNIVTEPYSGHRLDIHGVMENSISSAPINKNRLQLRIWNVPLFLICRFRHGVILFRSLHLRICLLLTRFVWETNNRSSRAIFIKIILRLCTDWRLWTVSGHRWRQSRTRWLLDY